MDDFDLPEDLAEDVEVIYLDGDIEDEDGNGITIEDENIAIDENGDMEELHIVDLSKLTFDKHKKSVFACDLSKDAQLAITGGEDDSAFLWSTETGEVILECTGHQDSVTSVCFSFDNQLVATGDMAGLVQVWSLKEKKLIWCYEGDDMEWMFWHPMTNALLAGTTSGDVYIWQVPSGACKILPSHGCPCSCGQVLPDGKKVVVGYSDGLLKLWDIKSTTVQWQYQDPNATGITSIALNQDGSLISLAPQSSLVKSADGKLLTSLLVDGETEIESQVFDNELNVLVTGSISGQLCVWDIGRQTIRHQARIECAVTIIKLGLNGRIYVGAADGAVYVCDVRSGTLLETLTGHKSDILGLAVVNNTVLTCSDDGTAKVFLKN